MRTSLQPSLAPSTDRCRAVRLANHTTPPESGTVRMAMKCAQPCHRHTTNSMDARQRQMTASTPARPRAMAARKPADMRATSTLNASTHDATRLNPTVRLQMDATNNASQVARRCRVRLPSALDAGATRDSIAIEQPLRLTQPRADQMDGRALQGGDGAGVSSLGCVPRRRKPAQCSHSGGGDAGTNAARARTSAARRVR
jgi:hypothetical protein